MVDGVATKGATPLLVAEGAKIAGIVVLEEIIKTGTKKRLDRLRKAGCGLIAPRDAHPAVWRHCGFKSVSFSATLVLIPMAR